MHFSEKNAIRMTQSCSCLGHLHGSCVVKWSGSFAWAMYYLVVWVMRMGHVCLVVWVICMGHECSSGVSHLHGSCV